MLDGRQNKFVWPLFNSLRFPKKRTEKKEHGTSPLCLCGERTQIFVPGLWSSFYAAERTGRSATEKSNTISAPAEILHTRSERPSSLRQTLQQDAARRSPVVTFFHWLRG
jgi:hypothetical protein